MKYVQSCNKDTFFIVNFEDISQHISIVNLEQVNAGRVNSIVEHVAGVTLSMTKTF